MTLPSRRNRQITAPSIRPANRIKQSLRASLASLIALGLGSSYQLPSARAQDWQPNRLPVDSSAQPLNQSATTASPRPDAAARPVLSSDQQLASGMVLRWRTTAPRGSAGMDNHESFGNSSSTSTSVYRSAASAATNPVPPVAPAGNGLRPDSNPLRYTSSNPSSQLDNPVRQATYQDSAPPQWRAVNVRRQDGNAQEGSQPQFGAPGGDALQPPSLDQNDLRLRNPGANGLQDSAPPRLDSPQLDLLDQPEAAPQPPIAGRNDPTAQLDNPPSFPRTLNEDRSPGDGDRLKSPDNNQDDSRPKNTELDDLDKLLKKARKASTPNCESQRDLLRGQPLSSISLNVAPRLNNGIRSADDQEDDEKLRTEFDKRALRRNWLDYKGNLINTGRMKELRYGNVVIDVDGQEQLIALNDLSDVDMSYIADVWNLPFRCGSGFEPLVGRDYIASTAQWKASGACHNPLYFEQVQLERYGHDAGPIVQPLLSSAHFFLTIPILPYKMGINPPNECQYPLGYFRPGNCAPYMLQPIPLSLRGGLAQTGAVLGMAAALP